AANGVHDLQALSGDEARRLEPELQADEALLSPSTGIIDTHGLMLSLRGELEAAGGAVALLSPVESVALGADAHRVEVSGESAMALSAPIVINAAGLWAPSLASRFAGLPDGE